MLVVQVEAHLHRFFYIITCRLGCTGIMGYVEQHSGSKGNRHFMRINKHLGSWLLAVWHTAPSNFIVSWMCLRKGHLVVKHLILTYILTFFDLARHQLQTSIYLSLFTWIAWDAPFSMIRCFTQFSSQHSQNHDKPRLANLCHLLHPAVAKGKHDRFWSTRNLPFATWLSQRPFLAESDVLE